MLPAVIERLVLFGATGDLAGRYLLPALAALRDAGRLPETLEVVGAAQEDLGDDAFRRMCADLLEQHAAGLPADARDGLVRSLRYRQVDITDHDSVAAVVADPASGAGGGPVAVYLALPPGLFARAVTALAATGPPAGSRIALEKPFGEDLESAMELNRLLAGVAERVGEHAAFRVDHFLGLAPVQNLLGLRFANRVTDVLWNSEHVEQVEIAWEETVALEGRAGYYDHAGQLKDVIQNHLLQVLCLVAMEPPAGLGATELRDRKLDVLRAVRPPRPDEMASRTRRARYTAGRIGDREVPSYADEDGVDPERCTETFAEVELEIDSPRWSRTRFVLRTGKAMGRERKEIVVRLRPAARLPFGDGAGEPAANELRIGLEQPGDVALSLAGSRPGPPFELTSLDLGTRLPDADLPEYGRVLLDFLSGDSTLSVRGDEAEEAWRIVAPVLEAWADGPVALEAYPAGSDGPPPAARRGEIVTRPTMEESG
jgi:glucose-6-phosphate 1-dehydrogenase